MSAEVANSVRKTGANKGDIVVGARRSNAGVRLQVLNSQPVGRDTGGPLLGEFQVVDAGHGYYREVFQHFLGRRVDAEELLDWGRTHGWPTMTHLVNSNGLQLEQYATPPSHPNPGRVRGVRANTNFDRLDEAARQLGSPPLVLHVDDIILKFRELYPTSTSPRSGLTASLDYETINVRGRTPAAGDFDCPNRWNKAPAFIKVSRARYRRLSEDERDRFQELWTAGEKLLRKPEYGVKDWEALLDGDIVSVEGEEEYAAPPEPVRFPPRGTYGYRYSAGDRPIPGYTIQRPLGRGGFGEVYLGVSDAGREVAIKAIHTMPDVEERGLQACMNLKSPHLVVVHDLVKPDPSSLFVIMDHIEGPCLRNVLKDAPRGLSKRKAAVWIHGIAAGLGFLHERGIVHRDLKPDNVFEEDGYVKISDYSLAKAIAASQQTGQTSFVGSLHYMAPEVSLGRYHRPVDIYSLGVIIFELLTGRVPFTGESPGEVLAKHLQATPDIHSVPRRYRRVVQRALAKDPEHRYPDVRALLAELP